MCDCAGSVLVLCVAIGRHRPTRDVAKVKKSPIHQAFVLSPRMVPGLKAD